jgi:transcriptional regulator of acetoin/glycerol metabolism
MRQRKPITRDAILTALDETDHDVETAARLLEVSGRTLYRRMREYGIQRTDRYVLGEREAA